MKKFGKFLGMRNDVPAEKFTEKDLAATLNVDLDDEGTLSSRDGTRTILPGQAHSVTSYGDRLIGVVDQDLCEVFDDGSSVVLAPGAIVGSKLSAVEVEGALYWTDGVITGVLRGMTVETWGLDTPKQAVLSEVSGSLREGTYLVSSVAVRGVEESGAAPYAAITVAANAGIQVELPVVAADYLDLYISDTSGAVPYFYGRYSPSGGTEIITEPVVTSRAVPNLRMGPAPYGSKVFYFAGRIWVVRDRFLLFSQPYQYGLFDKANGYATMPARVRMAVPVDDGIFIATDSRTYFLAGRDPATASFNEVANYGAVAWSDSVVDSSMVGKEGVSGTAVMWATNNGVCLGTNGGNLKNVTGSRYVPKQGRIGAAVFKKTQTASQFAVSIFT
jgi:hypothetical protein